MSQPSNPSPNPPQKAAPARPDSNKTLLLSDVPEAAALIPEMPAPEAPAAPLSSMDLTPLSQRYEILGQAGHGSMGHVFKARDRETGETVALKLLKPEIASDQAMMERFKNELLFARKITHKNVCRVYEFNRIGGIAYTSMEFVEGESLRAVLTRFEGLPARKALDLAQQICSGLQEAHAQGIVHRDLKPENVMIDWQGNVKIMDFGIARSMEAGTRLTGSMVGTPAYMAPEQVAGKPVDYRTDIYALGLILYEVFTGKQAFQAENAVAAALKQMREAPVPPHEIEPAIPVPMERAILRCLEKEPAKRFQSVADLKSALVASKPVAAPAASAVPATAAPGRPAHSEHIAPHPLYGSSALLAPKPQRASWWVLLGIFLATTAFAGWHWKPEVARAAQKYLPPSLLQFARISDLASEPPPGPTAEQPGAQSAGPADAQPQTSPDAGQQSAESQPSDASLASAPPPAPPQPRPSQHKSAPSEAAPSADTQASAGVPAAGPALATPAAPPPAQPGTSGENAAPKASPRAASHVAGGSQAASAPAANDRGPSYVWVGRFEREDRAQSKAKQIEDLGLPVAVVPRRNMQGQFFVVLAGPFSPEQAGSVLDWIHEQGIPSARLVKNPMRNRGQGYGTGQGPNP